ncbi:MAG: phosphoribosylamine--glycine ligase [Bacteroidales bacterium]|nr:phosphoribosylamine--glycine ligase [Candidatus Colimorpha onthohippi]
MNILLLGSGGREHAMAYKLSQSELCDQLYIAPGNGGTNECGVNVNLKVSDFAGIADFALSHNVKLLVVGPEAPLVGGIADYFASRADLCEIAVIGPSKDGAMLEGSKDYAKAFMLENKIPTARYRTFSAGELDEAYLFLDSLQSPYVLKADGLAAGKGVLILDDVDDAKRELRAMLLDAKFGDASAKVVIEEYLSGIEMSAFVLTDGHSYVMLPEAKDYKRIGEGDTGLNTGGMGSVSPVCFADDVFMEKVRTRIVKPTIQGLRHRKIKYCGFIFIGLMAVKNAVDGSLDPYVIEYNVRMGDPESESVFPRIKSDLVSLLCHAAEGTLDRGSLIIDSRTAACVMMVASGYPESYRKGDVISMANARQGGLIFHAGTALSKEGNLVTAGGRVMCVTALDNSLPEALNKAYQMVDKISWDGKYQRRDIGQDLLRMQLDK